MTDVLTSNLQKKNVVRMDGVGLGTLKNLTADLSTGKLEFFIVTPPGGNATEEDIYDIDDEGNYRVPIDQIDSIQEHIMVKDGLDVMS
jgi:sporulation protein YlmC with PRC-barrel domain